MIGRPTTRSLLLSLTLGAATAGGCASDDDAITFDARTFADPIITEGLTDADPWIRAETVRLMGAVGDRRLAPRIAPALGDSSPLVQNAAIEVLLRLSDPSAENAALSLLVSGTVEQRMQLVGLVTSVAEGDFRRLAIERSLRDGSAEVRGAAVEALASHRLRVSADVLERLVDDPDVRVADTAFGYMAHIWPAEARDAAMRRLRSDDPVVRQRGIAVSRHLASPDLWPSMRSYASAGSEGERRMAMLVLGRLGDPMAEEVLRDLVLSADSQTAAIALDSLAYIDTPRAHDQARRHRSDARAPVRATAFDVLMRQNVGPDVVEAFLSDSDPELAYRALVALSQRDPSFTASAISHVLRTAEEPVSPLRALERAAQRSDIRPLLREALPALTELSDDPDPDIAYLAMSLRARVEAPASLADAVVASGRTETLYALLERSLADDANHSALYREAVANDLYLVRLAGALGMWRLNLDYVPAVAVE